MRDTQMLEQYLRGGSESAFADLVNRYVDLAYSVAHRTLRDRALAEEVAQMTFCLLARKARQLTGYDSLAGWIYRTSYLLSLKTLRQERTRREREHAIAAMPESTSETPWEELVPVLDDALHQLPDQDRTVLALRFAQGKPMREVGEALGTTEAAAKMRVGRAIDKVRAYFQKRGVACTSVSLMAALGAISVEAAPVGLASRVMTALAGSTAGSVGSLATYLVIMAKLKTKVALGLLGTAAALMTGSLVLNHSLLLIPRPHGSDAPTGQAGSAVQTARAAAQAPATFGESWLSKLREAGLARAKARLTAALNAPPRKGTRSYPSFAIFDAITAFGSYGDQAFEILKAAVEGDNEEARLQAISALGLIGKNVPEARPLLWSLLKAGNQESGYALTALGNVGFLPEELPMLATLIPGQQDQQLVRYVPEQIARAIKRDPVGTKAYLGSVEGLLQDADPAARFGAACALAELRGAQDPQIVKALAAGLAVSEAYRVRNEFTGEVTRHLMAVETLQRMGPAAKAALPELQAFAKQTPDEVTRELALRTIGIIDPDSGRNDPAIHSILASDEQRDLLLEKLQTGTCSADELVQALKEPRAVSSAAARLGELGPAAKSALPELHQALAGKDEATRDEILAAMQTIDPAYVVARVPREPVAQATLAAVLELEEQRSQGALTEPAAKALEKLLEPFRMGSTSWYTKNEVTEFGKKLQEQNSRLWAVFLAKASESDPDFEHTVKAGSPQ
jgi:RNA polymerase sigma factor (sigma-70 family)